MPQRPKRPCSHQPCPNLVDSGACAAHSRDTPRRLSARERGYTWEWEKYRKAYLARNPLCVECQRSGHTVAAGIVDHIVPHKGDAELFWDPKNHQSMCKPHHDAKTSRADGGFGNPRQS